MSGGKFGRAKRGTPSARGPLRRLLARTTRLLNDAEALHRRIEKRYPSEAHLITSAYITRREISHVVKWLAQELESTPK